MDSRFHGNDGFGSSEEVGRMECEVWEGFGTWWSYLN